MSAEAALSAVTTAVVPRVGDTVSAGGGTGEEARARPLTPREREVVALAREGVSTRDIGRRLGISTRAVAALLRDARHKLAANEGLGRPEDGLAR